MELPQPVTISAPATNCGQPSALNVVTSAALTARGFEIEQASPVHGARSFPLGGMGKLDRFGRIDDLRLATVQGGHPALVVCTQAEPALT